jgi:hypothetical protein
MGRSKTDAEVLRPEVRLLKDHPATRRLLREARERDVSLAQHIHDLLIAREPRWAARNTTACCGCLASSRHLRTIG